MVYGPRGYGLSMSGPSGKIGASVFEEVCVCVCVCVCANPLYVRDLLFLAVLQLNFTTSSESVCVCELSV